MDRKSRSTFEENERLRIRRMEWMLEQKWERKHEERKKIMIAEYDMRRNYMRRKSLRRRKSDSPPRRRIISTDYKHSEESGILSKFKYAKDIIIDKKELHKIKINVCNRGTFPMKNRCLPMEEIKRDIVNWDDIILPRRKDEGSYPLSERKEMNTKVRKIARDYQSVKEMSTSKERTVTYRKSPDNDRNSRYNNRYYSDFKSNRLIGYQNHRTSDNDRRNSNRSSSTRSSREGNERECESHSNSAERATRDRSNSRCRNKSPFTNGQAKETKINNDGNKYSSNGNLERSHGSDNCISGLTMSSHSYGNYAGTQQHLSQHFLRPTEMFGIQSPIIWPVVSGMFPMPFPPIPPNVHRWRPPPPRFANFGRRGGGNLRRP